MKRCKVLPFVGFFLRFFPFLLVHFLVNSFSEISLAAQKKLLLKGLIRDRVSMLWYGGVAGSNLGIIPHELCFFIIKRLNQADVPL